MTEAVAEERHPGVVLVTCGCVPGDGYLGSAVWTARDLAYALRDKHNRRSHP